MLQRYRTFYCTPYYGSFENNTPTASLVKRLPLERHSWYVILPPRDRNCTHRTCRYRCLRICSTAHLVSPRNNVTSWSIFNSYDCWSVVSLLPNENRGKCFRLSPHKRGRAIMYPIIIIIFIKCVTVLYIRTKMDFVVGDDYGGGGVRSSSTICSHLGRMYMILVVCFLYQEVALLSAKPTARSVQIWKFYQLLANTIHCIRTTISFLSGNKQTTYFLIPCYLIQK